MRILWEICFDTQTLHFGGIKESEMYRMFAADGTGTKKRVFNTQQHSPTCHCQYQTVFTYLSIFVTFIQAFYSCCTYAFEFPSCVLIQWNNWSVTDVTYDAIGRARCTRASTCYSTAIHNHQGEIHLLTGVFRYSRLMMFNWCLFTFIGH